MDQINIQLGDRIVQKNHGAHAVNIPFLAVRLLNIEAGDILRWTITNGELKIEQVVKPDEPRT